MYTELIFGARLNENTPNDVIETLKFMMGETDVKPEAFPFPDGRCEWLFRGSSYYFGVHKAVSEMYYDEIARAWTISTRSNIKNYEGEIETFLEWIKPYIYSGSGSREMYAVVTYEDGEPKMFYLHDQ